MEYFYRGFRFTKDKGQLDPRAVQRLLEQTYWANDRSLSVIAKSMKNSLCFGVFSPENRLVGFARMLTDYAVTYYVSDVGILLTTYAHSFYEKLGFERNAQKCMIRPANAPMHLNAEDVPWK